MARAIDDVFDRSVDHCGDHYRVVCRLYHVDEFQLPLASFHSLAWRGKIRDRSAARFAKLYVPRDNAEFVPRVSPRCAG
jgi:hypothetical protein